MKNKIIAFLIICLSLIACTEEGEVVGRSTRNIKINGKDYYFMKVVPEDGARGVWLLIPKDAEVEIPQSTSYNYTRSCGKNCHKTITLTAIWIR